MPWLIVVANALAALASLGAAAVATITPAALAGSAAVPSTRYYASMFTVRAVPIAVAVLAAMFLPVPTTTVIVVLALAGASQVGDLLIGIRRRIPGMIAGGGTAAIIHLASTAHLLVTH